MLLNSSRTPAHGALAKRPDLQEAYARYKRNTRGLLTWFQQRGPTPTKPTKSLTIRGLESLAQEVSMKLTSLQDIVHFYFREAISDRKRLSKYYRTQIDDTVNDPDTIGHEYFTARLEKIYCDLCSRFGDYKSPIHQKQELQSATSQPCPPAKQYHALVEEVEEAGEQDEDEVDISLQSADIASVPRSSTRDNADRIQDISSSIDGYWAAAGKGAISFVVASVMTNVAFASLRRVVNDLLQHDDSLSSSEFFRTCTSLRGSFEAELRNQKIIGSNASLLSRLEYINQTLSDCQDDEDLFLHDPACARCGLRLANEVHSRVIKGTAGSRLISSAMTENIAHLVSSEVFPLNVVMRSTPVYSDLAEDLITETKNNKESWSAILGLHLLTQSYRVYLRYFKQPHLIPKSRIIALKLAQQVCSQVTTLLEDKLCFPCRCSETLGWHLQNMAVDFRFYASHNCWDLVFQTPWVAGNHLLEILAICNYYGNYLLKYRHYVGAVLHSYNALTQLGGLDQIPVLEKISSQFSEALFPGGRVPSSNFQACWARFVGARLKFKKNHKGKNAHENWCLAIPPHVAKVAAGIGIPDHRQKEQLGCMLFQIKQQDYHVSDRQWDEVNDLYVKVQQTRKNNGSKLVPAATGQVSSGQMEKQKLLPLAVTVQALFAGRPGKTLPMARVNLFAVFERCVRVVSTVSTTLHPQDKRPKEDHCVCFASAILSGADRLFEARRCGKLESWKERERKLVTDVNEAMLAAFGSVEEAELLWDV